MTKSNWNDIKNQYITTDISLRDLANETGVSVSTLTKKATSEKWNETRKQTRIKIEAKTAEKIIEKTAEKQSKINEKVLALAEKALKHIETHFEQSVIEADVLRKLVASLKDLQPIHRTCEGLDKDAQDNTQLTPPTIVINTSGNAEV